MHSWTNSLLNEVGIPLPIKSFVHQRYVTGQLNKAVHLPAVNANPYEAYLRPAKGNRILVGGETPNRQEHGTPSRAFRMGQLNAPSGFSDSLRCKVKPLLPILGGLDFANEKVGLISFTLDGEPILGAAPELPGLLVAASFHSGGFGYNPVAGILLADLAVKGETSINIDAFSPSRFDSAATTAYLGTLVPQKAAFSRRH